MQHAQFFSKASVFALTLGMLLMSGNAFSQEIQMNPSTPPPHLNQLKEDRKIKFIERIDTPGTGFIKTLGIIDRILKETGFMENYDHLLLTKHIVSWTRLLVEDIPWPIILRDYTALAAVCLTCLILGIAIFESRDLKS
jgi:hypothetical protein